MPCKDETAYDFPIGTTIQYQNGYEGIRTLREDGIWWDSTDTFHASSGYITNRLRYNEARIVYRPMEG